MQNLSQQKRQRMLEFLEQIKSSSDDEKTVIAINEIENELVEKKYGLVWEKHIEQVDEDIKTNVPVFTEVEDRAILSGVDDSCNFLLEGDNLHSLKLLEKTHAGKIDCIYIDPPYNINGDFIYNDTYIAKEDGYRHSKWCSFMSERLQIAKSLLSDKGAIFISIDKVEQAQLKLLCDEIFGVECYQNCISWQKVYSPKNNSKGIPDEVEYILVYSRNPAWQPHRLERTEEMNSKYSNPDNDFSPWMSSDCFAPGAISHQGMVYAIQHPFTGEMIYPYVGGCWRYEQSDVLNIMNGWAEYHLEDLNDAEERARVCGISADEVREGVRGIVLTKSLEESKQSAEYVLKNKILPRFYFTRNGLGGIRRKTYLENLDGKLPTNLWTYIQAGHNDEAKKELKNMFSGTIPFDTPKPVRLIKLILQVASNKDSVILDFFAGSGSTGQAVIEQNKLDNGNRRFILCTNNENKICEEITYQRLEKTIKGYTFTGKKEDILFEKKLTLRDLSKMEMILDKANKIKTDKENDYKKVTISYKDGVLKVVGEKDTSEGVEGISANLRYYKTEMIPKTKDDDFYSVGEELEKHIKEMIQLERGISLEDGKYLLILNDEDAENLEKNAELVKNCKAVYISSAVFLNKSQQNLLSGVEVITIPDYYFEEELREVGEL